MMKLGWATIRHNLTRVPAQKAHYYHWQVSTNVLTPACGKAFNRERAEYISIDGYATNNDPKADRCEDCQLFATMMELAE